MDALLSLSRNQLDDLKHVFDAKRGLTPTELCSMLLYVTRGTSVVDDEEAVQLVESLLSLFRSIDLDGDGTLDWDELLHYVITTGVTTSPPPAEVLDRYEEVPAFAVKSDLGLSSEKLRYLPSIGKVVSLDAHRPTARIYEAVQPEASAGMHLAGLIDLPRKAGYITDATHIPGHNVFVVTSEDYSVRVVDAIQLPTVRSRLRGVMAHIFCKVKAQAVVQYTESLSMDATGQERELLTRQEEVLLAAEASRFADSEAAARNASQHIRSISGCVTHRVPVLPVLTREAIRSVPQHVVWSSSAGVVLTSNLDLEVQVWEVNTKQTGVMQTRSATIECLQSIRTHDMLINSLTVVPQQGVDLVASASADTTVGVWKVLHQGLKELPSLEGHERPVTVATWIKGSRCLVTGGHDPFAICWNLDKEAGEEFSRLPGHRGGVVDIVEVAPEGTSRPRSECITIDKTATLRRWDMRRYAGERLMQVFRPDTSVSGSGFSPTGLLLVPPLATMVRQTVGPEWEGLPFVQALHAMGAELQAEAQTVEKLLSSIARRETHTMNAMANVIPAGRGVCVAYGKMVASFECRPKATTLQALPCAVLPSPPLNAIVVVMDDNMRLVEGDTGITKSIFSQVSQFPLTCAVLRESGRKVLIGDTNGDIHEVGCETGTEARLFCATSAAVFAVHELPIDQIIVAVSIRGEVAVLDERVDPGRAVPPAAPAAAAAGQQASATGIRAGSSPIRRKASGAAEAAAGPAASADVHAAFRAQEKHRVRAEPARCRRLIKTFREGGPTTVVATDICYDMGLLAVADRQGRVAVIDFHRLELWATCTMPDSLHQAAGAVGDGIQTAQQQVGAGGVAEPGRVASPVGSDGGGLSEAVGLDLGPALTASPPESPSKEEEGDEDGGETAAAAAAGGGGGRSGAHGIPRLAIGGAADGGSEPGPPPMQPGGTQAGSARSQSGGARVVSVKFLSPKPCLSVVYESGDLCTFDLQPQSLDLGASPIVSHLNFTGMAPEQFVLLKDQPIPASKARMGDLEAGEDDSDGSGTASQTSTARGRTAPKSARRSRTDSMTGGIATAAVEKAAGAQRKQRRRSMQWILPPEAKSSPSWGRIRHRHPAFSLVEGSSPVCTCRIGGSSAERGHLHPHSEGLAVSRTGLPLAQPPQKNAAGELSCGVLVVGLDAGHTLLFSIDDLTQHVHCAPVQAVHRKPGYFPTAAATRPYPVLARPQGPASVAHGSDQGSRTSSRASSARRPSAREPSARPQASRVPSSRAPSSKTPSARGFAPRSPRPIRAGVIASQSDVPSSVHGVYSTVPFGGEALLLIADDRGVITNWTVPGAPRGKLPRSVSECKTAGMVGVGAGLQLTGVVMCSTPVGLAAPGHEWETELVTPMARDKLRRYAQDILKEVHAAPWPGHEEACREAQQRTRAAAASIAAPSPGDSSVDTHATWNAIRRSQLKSAMGSRGRLQQGGRLGRPTSKGRRRRVRLTNVLQQVQRGFSPQPADSKEAAPPAQQSLDQLLAAFPVAAAGSPKPAGEPGALPGGRYRTSWQVAEEIEAHARRSHPPPQSVKKKEAYDANSSLFAIAAIEAQDAEVAKDLRLASVMDAEWGRRLRAAQATSANSSSMRKLDMTRYQFWRSEAVSKGVLRSDEGLPPPDVDDDAWGANCQSCGEMLGEEEGEGIGPLLSEMSALPPLRSAEGAAAALHQRGASSGSAAGEALFPPRPPSSMLSTPEPSRPLSRVYARELANSVGSTVPLQFRRGDGHTEAERFRSLLPTLLRSASPRLRYQRGDAQGAIDQAADEVADAFPLSADMPSSGPGAAGELGSHVEGAEGPESPPKRVFDRQQAASILEELRRDVDVAIAARPDTSAIRHRIRLDRRRCRAGQVLAPPAPPHQPTRGPARSATDDPAARRPSREGAPASEGRRTASRTVTWRKRGGTSLPFSPLRLKMDEKHLLDRQEQMTDDVTRKLRALISGGDAAKVQERISDMLASSAQRATGASPLQHSGHSPGRQVRMDGQLQAVRSKAGRASGQVHRARHRHMSTVQHEAQMRQAAQDERRKRKQFLRRQLARRAAKLLAKAADRWVERGARARAATIKLPPRPTQTRGEMLLRRHLFGCYSRQDVQTFKELFKNVDEDGNGAVSLDEWMLAGSELPALRERLELMFRALDSDGDGELSIAELAVVVFPDATPEVLTDILQFVIYDPTKDLRRRTVRRKYTDETKQRVLLMFTALDTEKRGVVGAQALRLALQIPGAAPTFPSAGESLAGSPDDKVASPLHGRLAPPDSPGRAATAGAGALSPGSPAGANYVPRVPRPKTPAQKALRRRNVGQASKSQLWSSLDEFGSLLEAARVEPARRPGQPDEVLLNRDGFLQLVGPVLEPSAPIIVPGQEEGEA